MHDSLQQSESLSQLLPVPLQPAPPSSSSQAEPAHPPGQHVPAQRVGTSEGQPFGSALTLQSNAQRPSSGPLRQHSRDSGQQFAPFVQRYCVPGSGQEPSTTTMRLTAGVIGTEGVPVVQGALMFGVTRPLLPVALEHATVTVAASTSATSVRRFVNVVPPQSSTTSEMPGERPRIPVEGLGVDVEDE
jgi:hypothetical protein